MKKKKILVLGDRITALKKELGDKFEGFSYQKEVMLSVFKGTEITDEQLAKINTFALEEQTKETVYVRKFIACHNMIDRDNERFSEPLLDDYAKTFPGKSFLVGHDVRSLAKGLVFEAYIEEMAAAEFKKLTNEKTRLPEGVDKVTVLFAWVYFMKIPDNETILANLDGGVYRHVSIGFSATDIVPVKEDTNGPVLYWEFIRPGESRELSLVYLGAQNGATSQKSLYVNGKEVGADDALIEHRSSSHKSTEKTGGDKDMKEFLKKLGKKCGKSFSEDDAVDEIMELIGGKDTEIQDLTTERDTLKTEVKDLKPLAADGKAYRESLVDRYVAAKAKLGECDETEDAQKGVKDVVTTYPIKHLETEVDLIEKRVAEKFPAEPQTEAGDPDGTRTDGKKASLIPEDDE